MTTSFKQFLESLEPAIISGEVQVLDSINDKGRLKAIFIAGIPGAGKSYSVKSLSGSIQPAVVNIDRATEWITKATGVKSDGSNWATHFKDRAERMTKNALYQQLDGIRPLFIDGTTSNPDSILRRAKMLESIGYDVGMIFIRADLDVALRRAAKRAEVIGRHVDDSFIKSVHAESEKNIPLFQSRFDFFKIHENNIDFLDNTVLERIFSKTQRFFNEPVHNEIGQETIKQMMEKRASYLVPAIMSSNELKAKVNTWYQ